MGFTMTVADFELAHSIELEVWLNGKKTIFLTTVEKVMDQTVLLSPVRIGGKLLGFPPTCTVNLIYSTDEGAYSWSKVTVKAVKYDKNVYHSVTLLTEGSSINRRNSYRVFIGSQMTITTFTSNGPKSLPVLIKNVSEGGFAFFSTEVFEVGRTIRFNLTIKKSQELRLAAQIVRCQEDEDRPDRLYGCKFLEKNPLLAAYLMHLQQEHQKRKMGM